MKVKEWIEYLIGFPEDSEVTIMVIDKEERMVQGVEIMTCITDSENPAAFLELGEKQNMDMEDSETEERSRNG